MLNFYNNTTDVIKIHFYNINETVVLEQKKHFVFNSEDEEIQFEIFANISSVYSTFKMPQFQVSSKYYLKNTNYANNIFIKKQIAEDSSYNKFIRFVCDNDTIFHKIEYRVFDGDIVEQKIKKESRLVDSLNFLESFFSKVNFMFIALGIGIGNYFGIKIGIISYLVIFSLYYLIIILINNHFEKNTVPKDAFSNQYIYNLFQQEYEDDSYAPKQKS